MIEGASRSCARVAYLSALTMSRDASFEHKHAITAPTYTLSSRRPGYWEVTLPRARPRLLPDFILISSQAAAAPGGGVSQYQFWMYAWLPHEPCVTVRKGYMWIQ